MYPISLSNMEYWANPIEKFTIDISKSWMAMSSWIYVTGGSQGVWLLSWFINLRLENFLLCSYSIENILNTCFDGYQFCSFEIVMCWHVSISSYVGYRVIYPHVNPTIDIGIWILKSASITSGLCWLVGSSQIGIPKYWHLLGFIKVFSILLTNHNLWPNIIIITCHDSIVCEVAPINIAIFTCS